MVLLLLVVLISWVMVPTVKVTPVTVKAVPAVSIFPPNSIEATVKAVLSAGCLVYDDPVVPKCTMSVALPPDPG